MSEAQIAAPVTVAEGFGFTEGPRWHQGALWFSDFFTLGVYRLVPGSAPEQVCEVPGGPSGLGFDPAGRLLVVSMGDRRILRLEDGELVVHADLAELAPASLNDMVVLPDGGIYVGNFGANAELGGVLPATRMIYVDPAGGARFTGGEIYAPNGTVVADGGRTLLVAETLGARIVAFPIGADGELGTSSCWARLGPEPAVRGLYAAMASGPVPDGIALDAAGALWVGTANGTALRVAPGGEVLARLDAPGPDCVYALAFGGADLRTLYMCVAPSLRDYWPAESAGAADAPAADRQAKVLAARADVPGA